MLHPQNNQTNTNNNINASTNYLKQENYNEQAINLDCDSLANMYQYTHNIDQANMKDERVKNCNTQNVFCLNLKVNIIVIKYLILFLILV